MKKNIMSLLFFIVMFTNPFNALHAAAVCDGSSQHPCIVLDTQNHTPLIHWRDSLMIAKTYKGNIRGLNLLWLSGSAALSQQAWTAIRRQVNEATHNQVKNIIILDLRQESHGYLNHNAINLTTLHNWGNLGKTHQQALQAEQEWLKTLRKKPFATGILTHEQFKTNQFTLSSTIPVISINSEQEIARKTGYQYFRLTVPDHMRPQDEEVDRFVSLVRNLSPNTWLHIHCRGGEGRTTTFMVMYDMLHNANKASLRSIIERHASVPPYYDLLQVNRSDNELSMAYQERSIFLENFYRFAQAYLNGYTGSWTSWLAAKQ